MQNQIYDLIKLLTDFQNIERAVVVPGSSRKENDTEHSYNLAMTAWLIIEKDKLPLDLGLCIKYALIHDLVEVYAGDTFALDSDQVATKVEREHAALKTLRIDALTKDLALLIEDYERGASEEAKFIYSLDKLMPVFGILYGKDLVWKRYGLTQADWETMFKQKVEISKFTKPYLDFVIAEQKAHPELFA